MALRSRVFDRIRGGALVLAGIITMTLSPATAQDTNPRSIASEAQSEAMRFLAAQAARVAVDKLAGANDTELDELKGAALAEIQQHIPENRTRTASEIRVRSLIDRQLQQQLDTQIDQIAATMLAGEKISANDFRRTLGTSFDTSVSSQKAKFLTANFDAIFNPARGQAVAAQVALLERSVYPTQSEVDEADRKGWTASSMQDLMTDVRQKAGQKVANRFEETDKEIENISNGIEKEVTGQRDRQLAELQKDVAEALVSRGQIEMAFRQAVDSGVQRARGAEQRDHPVYAILPSVEQGLHGRAGEEEQRRWKQFVDAFSPSFDGEKLAARIRADLPGHRDPDRSEKIFLQESVVAASQDIVERYTAKAASAPDLAPFRARLQGSLGDTGATRPTLETAVKRALGPALKEARARVVGQQFHQTFEPLASGSWQAPEELLRPGALDPAAIRDLAQVDKLPGVRSAGAPTNPEQLLLETEKKAVEATQRLVKEGQNALNGQLHLVEREKPKIEALLKQPPPEAPTSQDYWASQLRNLVLQGWSQERPNLWRDAKPAPDIAARKYAELFQATNVEIERVIAELLANVSRVEPTQKKPEEPPSEPWLMQLLHEVPLWVWALLVAILVAATILLFRLRRPARPARAVCEVQPRTAPPTTVPPLASGGTGPSNQGGGGAGPPGQGGGGAPSELIPFEGIVIEVRDLERILSEIGELTDLGLHKRDKVYGIYKVGPITVSFVLEGHVPAEVKVKGKILHIERLQRQRLIARV